jgi:pilus assembly protein CpaB
MSAKKSNTVPLISGIAVALLGAFMVNQHTASKIKSIERKYTQDTVFVAVADQDLQVGDSVAADAVGWVEIPKEPESWAWIRFPEAPNGGSDGRRRFEDTVALAISGRIMKHQVKKGELLLETDMLSDGALGLNDLLTGNQRAVAITVDSNSLMGGLLNPNDRIDVLATYNSGISTLGRSGREVKKTVVILKDVSVLAVGGRTAAGMSGGRRGGGNSIVLALSADQALRLAHVQKEAQLSLLLRSQGDGGSQGYSQEELSSEDLGRMIEMEVN